MMRWFILMAVAMSVTVVASFASIRRPALQELLHGPTRELDQDRLATIHRNIQDAAAPIVVFGDSITYGARLPATLCGHPVVNAGVTGASIGYLQRHLSAMLGWKQPTLSVVAIGVNDAWRQTDNFRAFDTSYKLVVTRLSRLSPVVVATITGIAPGTFSVNYDAALLPELNKTIQNVGQSASIVDLTLPFAQENLTGDGIHLTSRGNALWSDVVTAGIRRAMTCTRSGDTDTRH